MNQQRSEYQTATESTANSTCEGLQQLVGRLAHLYGIQDPIQREYELVQTASKFDLPLDSFRQMYKDYCQQQIEAEWLRCWWKSPWLRLERGLERFNHILRGMDIFQILEYLGKLSIIVGVVVFLTEIPQRAEQKAIEQKRSHYEAWQIINTNREQKSSGGRIDALRELNKDEISLAGLNAEDAILIGIDLKNANLIYANLSGTELGQANLSGANLSAAYLSGANLHGANLSGADLTNTKLNGDANLTKANLHGADLTDTDLSNANLSGTDLTDTVGLTPSQVKKAKNWQEAKYSERFRQQLGLPQESINQPK